MNEAIQYTGTLKYSWRGYKRNVHILIHNRKVDRYARKQILSCYCISDIKRTFDTEIQYFGFDYYRFPGGEGTGENHHFTPPYLHAVSNNRQIHIINTSLHKLRDAPQPKEVCGSRDGTVSITCLCIRHRWLASVRDRHWAKWHHPPTSALIKHVQRYQASRTCCEHTVPGQYSAGITGDKN